MRPPEARGRAAGRQAAGGARPRAGRVRLLAFLPPLLLVGCMVGPDYHRPAPPLTPAFKEAPPPGWKVSEPRDALGKGSWWSVYRDPVLDGLEARVAVSNQNVKVYEAQFREAQAVVDEARSQLFPVLSGTASAVRTGRGGTSVSSLAAGGGLAGTGGTLGLTGSGYTGSGGIARTTYALEGSASWDLDVWGRIRRQVQSDVASAQVNAADLANATLSAQATLAIDYFELRSQDALARLLQDTVTAYAETLRITENQATAGTAAPSDVAAAETQLAAAQAQLVSVGVLRQQYEHAIAVLAGLPPAALTLPPGAFARDVPVAPAGLPSALLERRPDIAAAERTMMQQNALIGVQVAAYYPDISLSALYGYSGNPIGSLVQAANRVWSLGATATEAVFEGGLRNSAVAAARAAYDASVATYRQTVLTAFEQVEDQLSSLRILEQQGVAEAQAVSAAERAVRIAVNEYRAGTVTYTTVLTEQTALLSAQQTALAVQESRLVASVTLIEALGGGWTTGDLPGREALQRGLPFLKY